MDIKKDTFIACDTPFQNADIVILGAGFDSTTTYRPGARFAPSAIRKESYSIETYSPYQDKDLEDIKVCDAGDLDLPISDTKRVLEVIEDGISEILKANKLPILLGGEHLVTLGSIRAILQKYNDVIIVHFDAHADLRDDYLSDKLSHSTVIRRCYEQLVSREVHQFGIRSGDRQEFEFAKKSTKMQKFNFDGIEKIKDKKVYLTVDMDVLDPSEFPGTGTPEAGGVKFLELLKATKTVFENNEIVGVDIVELNPMVDNSGISTSLACKYLREVLLYI
ncbi:MAG: agmatinase [Firmicutes bacterium]|nr:agmatinase [Bacillota bacterium]